MLARIAAGDAKVAVGRDFGISRAICEEEAQTMMGAARKGMPRPEERPDLYDGYDCQEREPLSQDCLDQAPPSTSRS